MNFHLNGLQLNDAAGPLIIASTVHRLRVSLSSALVGTLTITGVVDADGQPVAWDIPAGSDGTHLAPGAAIGAGHVAYVLSDPASDAGKAFAVWSLER